MFRLASADLKRVLYFANIFHLCPGWASCKYESSEATYVSYSIHALLALFVVEHVSFRILTIRRAETSLYL